MLKLYVAYQNHRARLLSRISSGLDDETGATVAEYALVLVLVSVAVIGVLNTLGATLQDKIQAIIERLNAASLPGT